MMASADATGTQASEGVYGGDNAFLQGEIAFEAPLKSAKGCACSYYHSAYARAAKEAEDSDKMDIASVYRFLAVLCSFYPCFDNREAPYGPYCAFEDGRRGYVPQDLTPTDIVAVRIILEQVTDPVLKARLGDILWILSKDHKAAALATDAYIESGKQLVSGKHWVAAPVQFQRAFQLAAFQGRGNPVWQRVADELDVTVRAITEEDSVYKACQLMNVMLDAGAGDANHFKGLAEQHALMATAAGEHNRARAYREVELRWCRLAKNTEDEQAARLAVAETYIAEAESHASNSSPSFFSASRCLAQGIEALRQAKSAPSRIADLKTRLAEYQQRSTSEMKMFEYKIDIAEGVCSARKHVDSEVFEDAVRRFALGMPLTDLDSLWEDVFRLQKEFPIAQMFATTFIESDGRVRGYRKGLADRQSDTVESDIESEMFRHAASYWWPIRASAYIEPGRLAIWSRHHPQFADVQFLVKHNPFVPPGHELIFGRGLLAGFAGDFIMSTHLLVPQIENSIRHVLKSGGYDVTNLHSDLTQQVKLLGPLFDMPEAKQIFGKEFIFELRGCLIEKSGYEFRNHLAHGFVGAGDCYTSAALTIWWLVLRLCMIGHLFVKELTENAEAG